MSRSILFLSAVFSSIQGLPPTPSPPQEIALPQYEQEMAAAMRLAKQAGQIILDVRASGGFVSDLFGNPIDYRSDNAKLKNGAIVCGSEELYQKVLRITAQ